MASCPETAPPPFACPSQDDTTLALLALLPRGKAWPANDGGGTYMNFKAWLAGLGSSIPAPSQWGPGFVQAAYFAAVATVLQWTAQQFCDLKAEFFCASASQTLDLWNAEYGLPDACDPRADLCTRVESLAGSDCAFFFSLAARAGWDIACYTGAQSTGARGGCCYGGNENCVGSMGIAAACVMIQVSLSGSVAYQQVGSPPLGGLLMGGQPVNCLPSILALQCLLARVAQAHLTLIYVLVA
jgi:uncharacterized protein YmfQ (DUF2313 family)